MLKILNQYFLRNFLISNIVIIISFKSVQKEFDLLSKTNMDRLQNILGLGMPTIIYEDNSQKYINIFHKGIKYNINCCTKALGMD